MWLCGHVIWFVYIVKTVKNMSTILPGFLQTWVQKFCSHEGNVHILTDRISLILKCVCKSNFVYRNCTVHIMGFSVTSAILNVRPLGNSISVMRSSGLHQFALNSKAVFCCFCKVFRAVIHELRTWSIIHCNSCCYTSTECICVRVCVYVCMCVPHHFPILFGLKRKCEILFKTLFQWIPGLYLRPECRYFEVYPCCLAVANALFSEVEWHISSH